MNFFIPMFNSSLVRTRKNNDIIVDYIRIYNATYYIFLAVHCSIYK